MTLPSVQMDAFMWWDAESEVGIDGSPSNLCGLADICRLIDRTTEVIMTGKSDSAWTSKISPLRALRLILAGNPREKLTFSIEDDCFHIAGGKIGFDKLGQNIGFEGAQGVGSHGHIDFPFYQNFLDDTPLCLIVSCV